jgi:hypothetical protein
MRPVLRLSRASVIKINGDNPRRTGEPCTLDRSKPYGAAADDHRGLATTEIGDPHCRADAGQHTTAKEAGAIQGISEGTEIAHCAETMQYSANADM